MSSSADLISKEFDSLFAAVPAKDEGRASLDALGGVVSAAGGSGNSQNAPSNSGVGSPQSQSSSGTSFWSEAGGIAEDFLGPIPSLVSDFVGLFTGGTKAPPVFEKYELPASINFQGAVSSTGSLDASDTNQFGNARDLVATAAPLAGGSAFSTTATTPSAPMSAPAVVAPTSSGTSGHTFHQTFNMQAFDGDGMAAMSDQIAASVRLSLLTSNALSDVITNDLN